MNEISNIPASTQVRMRTNSTLRLVGSLYSKFNPRLPFDLSGCSFVCKVGTVVVPVTITNAVQGKFELEFTPTLSSQVIATKWYLDLIDSSARIVPVTSGPFDAIAA